MKKRKRSFSLVFDVSSKKVQNKEGTRQRVRKETNQVHALDKTLICEKLLPAANYCNLIDLEE